VRIYIITDNELELLSTLVDRDPLYGSQGGSHTEFNAVEEAAHREAHAFYNYQVRTWISKMKEP
jgi:hypothetical protein